MTNNTVKKRTRTAKGDMLFYVLMMAWPILQFCVFYIAVKFNSILYSFQRYDKLSRTFTWTLDYVKSALKMMTTSPALVETMKMTLLFFLLCCLQALFHLNGMGFDIPAQLDGMPQLFEFLCEDANLRGIWLITVELLALF